MNHEKLLHKILYHFLDNDDISNQDFKIYFHNSKCTFNKEEIEYLIDKAEEIKSSNINMFNDGQPF